MPPQCPLDFVLLFLGQLGNINRVIIGVVLRPVFLRDMDFIADRFPLVAAFDKIALWEKMPIFQLHDMAAKGGQLNPGFPFLRHIHHAGLIEIIVPQLPFRLNMGDQQVIFRVVGQVDHIRNTVLALVDDDRLHHGKLASVQRFQTRGKPVEAVNGVRLSNHRVQLRERQIFRRRNIIGRPWPVLHRFNTQPFKKCPHLARIRRQCKPFLPVVLLAVDNQDFQRLFLFAHLLHSPFSTSAIPDMICSAQGSAMEFPNALQRAPVLMG